jgi:ABC-type sugar transport system permease subunit
MDAGRKSLFRKIISQRNAYALLAPDLLFLFVFMIAPFVWIFILSFREGELLEPKIFVGAKNYIQIVSNPQLLKSILNTLKYTATVIPAVFVIGMATALLLNSVVRGRDLFRALLFIPLLSSIVVAAIIWRYLVYPEYGPLSAILGFLHIKSPNWFGDTRVVIFTIALVELWRGVPFYTVTFLAGLQSVPKDIVEAGHIDGASYFRSLFQIIFPSMKPVLTFCLVMATIWALQLFDSVYVLTRGGPFNASSSIVWSIYENIFFWGRVGRGATMSVFLILIIAAVTVVNLRLTGFRESSR